MPGDADGRVIANAIKQAELEARNRDVTKPQPPAGTDGDSLRKIRGFDQISDQMLQERASFSLKDHMAGRTAGVLSAPVPKPAALDLTSMTTEELAGLEKAARQQRKSKEKA